MAQAIPERVWHLSRRDERPCVVSDRELLVLAELGHLRADDMLWRPDFDGYRSVRSLLGDMSVPRQARAAAATPPGAVETTTLPTMPTTTLGSAKRRINMAGVLGLLIAVALVGAGVVIYQFLATDPQPPTQNTALGEPPSAPAEAPSPAGETAAVEPPQPNPEPATATAASAASTAFARPKHDGVIVRTVKVVDIPAPEPSNPAAVAPHPAPEVSANAVPTPLKKPAAPMQSQSATSEEQARSAAPHPNPMGLGPFGFTSAN
jgi:hypothetical protein